MSGFLKTIATGIDNRTPESGRVLWILGTVAFIVGFNVFQTIALLKGQAFSPIEYGTGFGGGLATIMALGGAGIALKDRANPGNQPTTVAGDLNAANVQNVEIKQ